MSEHIDKHARSSTPMARAVRAVVAASGIPHDPPDHSDQSIVAWATPLVDAVARRVSLPHHMEDEDLRQETWLGIVQALKTYTASRGPLRHWLARHALQRAYDAARWAARHGDEASAVEIGEAEAYLEDLSASPEEIVFRWQPRQRLAHYAARLLRLASEPAKALALALMADGSGASEQRLSAAGFTPEQIDRARTELRALGLAAMRQVISENRFIFGQRRP